MTKIFSLLIELAEALGVSELNKLPKCWEIDVGDWHISVNGHGEERCNSDGQPVPPFSAFVEVGGWAMGVINPRGGVIAHGREEELIAALEKEIERLNTGASSC